MPNREYQSARTFASWHGLIEIAPTYSIFAGGDWATADTEKSMSGITRQLFRIAVAGIILINLILAPHLCISFRTSMHSSNSKCDQSIAFSLSGHISSPGACSGSLEISQLALCRLHPKGSDLIPCRVRSLLCQQSQV